MGRVTLTQGPDSSSKGAPGTGTGGQERVSPGKSPFPWHCPHLSAIRQPDMGLGLFKRGVGKPGVCAGPRTKRGAAAAGDAPTAAGVLCSAACGEQRGPRRRSQGPSHICIIRASHKCPIFHPHLRRFAQREPAAPARRGSAAAPVRAPGSDILVLPALLHPGPVSAGRQVPAPLSSAAHAALAVAEGVRGQPGGCSRAGSRPGSAGTTALGPGHCRLFLGSS